MITLLRFFKSYQFFIAHRHSISIEAGLLLGIENIIEQGNQQNSIVVILSKRRIA